MLLELSAKHRFIQKTARQFAAKEIEPIAAEIDREARFPWEVVQKMRPLQYFGLQVPRTYEGADLDSVGYAIVIEEISKSCAAIGVMIAVHNSVAAFPVLKFGTEDQKERFLRPLAKGEKIGSFCLTEPNAGSDPAGVESTATLDGDHFFLNGNKVFVTNGGAAEIGLIFCKTRMTEKKREMSVFILEAETPGLSKGQNEDLSGVRANPVCPWVMNNCPVPRENMLGEPGDGFRIAFEALDTGRIGIAAQALGIGQACLEASITYARQREQFGQPIGRFQFIQGFIADMAVELEAARLLIYKAAYFRDSGKAGSLSPAAAKLFASEAAMNAARKGVQIHGGYGLTRAYPIERFFRDAKVTEIYEGTSEVQRLVIAREVLKSKGV